MSLKTPSLKVSPGVFSTHRSPEGSSSGSRPLTLTRPRPRRFLSRPLAFPAAPARTPAPPAEDYKSRRAARPPAGCSGLGAWRPPSSARGTASRRRPCGEVSDPLVLPGRWGCARPLPSPGCKEVKKNTIKTALPSFVSGVCPVQLVAPVSVESVTLQ